MWHPIMDRFVIPVFCINSSLKVHLDFDRWSQPEQEEKEKEKGYKNLKKTFSSADRTAPGHIQGKRIDGQHAT